MAYNVQAPGAWTVLPSRQVYRFLLPDATYAPDAPWASLRGRFDNGERLTLYTSNSPEAAVAEYFRRHPELLPLQNGVLLRTFELSLVVRTEGTDVRTEAQSLAVGFPWERLRSSDRSEQTRYAECRALADDVEQQDGVGILHLSAAYEAGETLVLFHAPSDFAWHVTTVQEVPTPQVTAAQVRAIES